MKKAFFLFFVLALASVEAPCQPEQTIDEKINEVIGPATKVVSDVVFFSLHLGEGIDVPLILVWLFLGALFFTVYLKFINIRGFRESVKIVGGAYANAKAPGEVTHFQALATAISGTVGLGNIAGVAIAIALGGPGATFWMILAGFLGMSSKFVECTLAVKYRRIGENGVVYGGPMYYLKQGLAKRGMKRLGIFLSAFFAIMCVGGSLGGGNMFQSNQAVQQVVSLPFLQTTFIADNSWFLGLLFALLVALTIIGGIKSIARVTEKLVPLMCIIYIIGVFIVVISNINSLPGAILKIFDGAFNGEAVAGGVVGAMIQGFRRAMFSNESGMGSAAIAHSAVKTDEPVTEGFVANLEPFIDTVVVCTMTALVIVITDSYRVASLDGIQLTSRAFGSVAYWFPYALSLVVVLFAFSTMISWSYYGLKSWTFLFGRGKASEITFKLLFCGAVVVGSSLQMTNVVNFSDAMVFAMSIPNIVGMYLMASEVRTGIEDFYKKRGKNSGQRI